MNSTAKAGLHPRSRHGARYDLKQLVRTFPPLGPFVRPHEHGGDSIDFADPAAVKALNRALLAHDYGIIHWDIPSGYLCPPIPGRADYVHHVADLLASDADGRVPCGPAIVALDIGVGANCVYPIIGTHEYGWRFVASELDAVALRNAQKIVAENPALTPLVECRRQSSATGIFRGVIRPGERFDLTLCNPPFHASSAAAASGTLRKLRNLGGEKRLESELNFGGQPTELWCQGGELAFIRRMISESVAFAESCRWFTTLVSKAGHVPLILGALQRVKATARHTIPMRQGQKQSRVVAWTFQTERQKLKHANDAFSSRPSFARRNRYRGSPAVV